MGKKTKNQNSEISIDGSVETRGDIVGRDKVLNASGDIVSGDGTTIINAEHVSINDRSRKVTHPATNLGHCPICGKLNRLENTFKCKKCQRPLNCMGHMNKELLLCSNCVDELEAILNKFHSSLEDAISNENRYVLNETMTTKALSNFNPDLWSYFRREFKRKENFLKEDSKSE